MCSSLFTQGPDGLLLFCRDGSDPCLRRDPRQQLNARCSKENCALRSWHPSKSLPPTRRSLWCRCYFARVMLWLTPFSLSLCLLLTLSACFRDVIQQPSEIRMDHLYSSLARVRTILMTLYLSILPKCKPTHMRTVDFLVPFWQSIIVGAFAACNVMCIMPSRAHRHFRPVWKPLYNEKQVNFTHH